MRLLPNPGVAHLIPVGEGKVQTVRPAGVAWHQETFHLDGRHAFTTFQGGTTGDKFLTYLKDVLIPTLRPGDIVVMDNLRTHHIQAVSELLHGAGAQILYLPPYSPDLNPIEKLWSKVKAILRKLRIRSPDALDAAIRFALDQVSADDCAGWFCCAGFCLF